MKRLLSLLMLACLAVPANARNKHHGGFVNATLGCAINTSHWLLAHGFRVKPTWSSRDFVRYRRVARSSARFGDVAHTWRGNHGQGHVQIVLRNAGGTITCLNPSHRHHGWVEKACPANATFHRIG